MYKCRWDSHVAKLPLNDFFSIKKPQRVMGMKIDDFWHFSLFSVRLPQALYLFTSSNGELSGFADVLMTYSG